MIQAAAKFRDWRDAWEKLGKFQGPELPEPSRRVSDILELWQAPIPEPWMRSEADTPQRLLSGPRYTRGNRHGIRPAEHEIEYEILVTQFDRVTYRGQPLLDGVNAYPLVKDSAGGRSDNVEADSVLLSGRADSASILVSDVKKTDGNPWTALVQNLRQLRLFTANLECASLLNRRGVTANVVQICGGVVAPKSSIPVWGRKQTRYRGPASCRNPCCERRTGFAPNCLSGIRTSGGFTAHEPERHSRGLAGPVGGTQRDSCRRTTGECCKQGEGVCQ